MQRKVSIKRRLAGIKLYVAIESPAAGCAGCGLGRVKAKVCKRTTHFPGSKRFLGVLIPPMPMS